MTTTIDLNSTPTLLNSDGTLSEGTLSNLMLWRAFIESAKNGNSVTTGGAFAIGFLCTALVGIMMFHDRLWALFCRKTGFRGLKKAGDDDDDDEGKYDHQSDELYAQEEGRVRDDDHENSQAQREEEREGRLELANMQDRQRSAPINIPGANIPANVPSPVYLAKPQRSPTWLVTKTPRHVRFNDAVKLIPGRQAVVASPSSGSRTEAVGEVSSSDKQQGGEAGDIRLVKRLEKDGTPIFIPGGISDDDWESE